MKRIILLFIILITTLTLGAVTSNAAAEPMLTVDNYNVTVTEAEGIRDMRYALGLYTTAAEIKEAAGNVALSQSIVKAHTSEGVFRYTMPKGGYYTLWIRMLDGTNYIKPLDLTSFTPYVTSYGVRMTVHNLYDVKDIFIDKGEFETYEELKKDGYIFSVGAKKIDGRHDYTYTVREPGIHTLLIRYNDGSYKAFHEELTVDEPTFTTNGLQISISNLPDVKVIRTAYGEWNTPKELKATDSIRSFSSKTAIKGRDPYTVQYRSEGRVTVIVEYNNGYIKVFHHDIQKKRPTLEQTAEGLRFGGLEGMVMIRYAPGELATAAEIKASPHDVVIKPSAAKDGVITVSDLIPGQTYSFYVQYDDESYSYYVIKALDIPQVPGEFTKHYEYTDAEGNTVDSLPYWLYTPGIIKEGMPLIVVLHSAHAKVKDTLTPEENLDNMVTGSFEDIPKYFYNGEFGNIPAYVVMPQTVSASRGWPKRGEELVGLVEYCKREFKVDGARISLMGYSLGGTGAVELAAAYPDVFSNVISVAGGLDGVTNNTRPYVGSGKRLELSTSPYSELMVLRDGSTDRYESETMKFLYAQPESRYALITDSEIALAQDFLRDRTETVAASLNRGSVTLWCISGGNDAEVEPSVSERICQLTEGSRCDTAEGCSHAGVLEIFLGYKDEIIKMTCS